MPSREFCTQSGERECDSYTSALPYVSETGISLTDTYKYYTANREPAKETKFRQASKIIQQLFSELRGPVTDRLRCVIFDVQVREELWRQVM